MSFEDDYFKLKELRFPNKKLVHESNDKMHIDDETRLYYSLNDPGNGFDFCCVTSMDGEMDECEFVEVLFSGIALFDGIRHVYFGENIVAEANGYFNHLNIDLFISALETLQELENTYCRDVE